MKIRILFINKLYSFLFNFTTQTVYNQISTTGAKKNLIDHSSDSKTPSLRIGNTRFDAKDITSIQVKAPSAEQLASITFDMADVIPTEEYSFAELLSFAYSLEKKSEHPLAKAIISYGKENDISLKEVNDFSAEVGNGVRGKLNGKDLVGGSYKYISTIIKIDSVFVKVGEKLSNQGKTPLYFVYDNSLVGIIAVAGVAVVVLAVVCIVLVTKKKK